MLRSRAALRVLLVPALTIAIAAPISAQEPDTYWVSGHVEAAGSGRPIEGVAIRVDGVATKATVSDNVGAWRIGPLPAGIYTMSVGHIGYASIERRIDVPLDGATMRLSLTERPLALDAVVVTAGRRLQRLADAVVATELVGRDEIEQSGASDLASVLTERMGVELEGGHPVGSGLMIQGMSSERVLVLVDGQPYIGRIAGSIDVSRVPTSMIERVELVKGPQSTLYGSEAMGGVVNVITRSADVSSMMGSVTATAGNQGRVDVAVNGSAGVGPVTALVDVGRRSMDLAPGYDAANGAVADRWDALAKLGWRTLDEQLHIEVSGLYLDENQRWRSGQLYSFADNTQWSGRVAAVWEHGRHRLTPTIYATAFDHLSRRANDATPVEDTGESETQRLAEAEVLYGLAAGAHSIDLGLETRREVIRSDRVIGSERRIDTGEAFVQSTFVLGSFSIVPGLRASWTDEWGEHWTPRIAALYRPVPSLAIRVSAGEGFRAPAFKELYMEFLNIGPGFSYTVRGNPQLQPEVSRNLTASVEWAGQRTYVRVQAYENRFDDFIETRAAGDSSGVTVYTYGNVDDGFTRGSEIEAGAALGAWRIEAGYAVLRAEHAATGEPLLGRPEQSMRGTLSYAHPVGLRLAVTGIRTGRTAMSRTDAETAWRDPFTRVDVRAATDLPGGFKLVAGADNVFDRRIDDWPGFTGRHIYTNIAWRAGGAN